jgi:hypothetical protein
MARGTVNAKRAYGGSETEMLRVVVEQLNNVMAELDALYAKMDADFADVTNASTDYAATLEDDSSSIVLL